MTLVKMGTYQGTDILYDPETEMVNLNQMWKAAGEPKSKDPRNWLKIEQTADLFVAQHQNGEYVNVSGTTIYNFPDKPAEYDPGNNHAMQEWSTAVMDLAREMGVIQTRRGKGGGTWAHRRIALAYGAYLNPNLHALILKWAEERMEEEANPDLAYQRGRERAIVGYKRRGWSEERIAQRLQGIDTRKAFTDKLQQHGVEKQGYRECTDAIYDGVLGGTAKELRQQRALPKKANVRESLGVDELSAVNFAEMVAGKRLERRQAQGNHQCKQVCEQTGSDVGEALKKLLEGE